MSYSQNLAKLKALKETRLRLARQRLQVAVGIETNAQEAAESADAAYEAKKTEAAELAHTTFAKYTRKQSFESFLLGLNSDHNRLRHEISELGKTVLDKRSTRQDAVAERTEAAKTHLDLEMKTTHFAAFADDVAFKAREAIEDASEEEITETLAGQISNG